jgi:hypothetical protein
MNTKEAEQYYLIMQIKALLDKHLGVGYDQQKNLRLWRIKGLVEDEIEETNRNK